LSVVLGCNERFSVLKVGFLAWKMALNFKIRLYLVEDDVSRPELLSPFFCQTGDTYADLRTRLENGGCVEWPFLFWDFQDECRILKRFEAMNHVTDRVYVIPALEDEGRLQKRCHPQAPGEAGSNDFAAEPQVEIRIADILRYDVAPMLEEEEVGAQRNPIEVYEEEETLLQSALLSADVLENYKRGAEKLRRELESMDFADHVWNLKTYDHHGMAIVKIFCGECKKEIGGTSHDHSRSAIQNLFANFKKSHLHSALHIKQWCKKREIFYNNHPKKEGNSSKPLILTPADHRRFVEGGVNILQSVNDSISEDDPPFVVVGDVGVPQFKSFWFKVRCKIDGELMHLCLQKGNLRANLENHIHGLLHTKCCEDLLRAKSSLNASCALSSGKRHRSARSRSTIGNHRDLHSWFNNLGSTNSITTGNPSGMHSDSILSLLCWGFRKKITEYAGKCYRVDSLLNDLKPGSSWIAEPNTTIDFVFKGKTFVVKGCFRHVQCKRLSGT
jgi:hypothetical protein